MSKNIKLAVTLLSIVLVTVMVSQLAMYGSVFRSCKYTVSDIPVPEKLASGYLKTTQVASSIENYKSYACAGEEFARANVITELQHASNYTFDATVTSTNLPVGQEFKITGVKKLEQHGLSLGGYTNNYFLVLEDASGLTYLVTPVSMGINKSDRYFTFVEDDGTKTMVGPDNFTTWGSEPFTFKLSN